MNHGRSLNNKTNQLPDGTLRLIYCDHTSTFQELRIKMVIFFHAEISSEILRMNKLNIQCMKSINTIINMVKECQPQIYNINWARKILTLTKIPNT